MLGYNQLLKEKCSYQKYLSNNKYNEKEYSDIIEVDCFTSFDFSNDRSFYEQSITLTKKIFIKNDFEPNVLDIIDGKEIKTIKPVKGLLTEVIGWEIIV